MTTTIRPRGRPKDAEAAQAAILEAAEAAFAEQGFAGARVDAIAAASGYNKSLIFHYFDDKLGLYTAVIQRSRRQAADMQARIFGSLADDAPVTVDTFRVFVEQAVTESFDYYLAHPRLLRILAWEEAEGWTTFKKISSRLDQRHLERFTAILDRAQRAGVLRQDISLGFVLSIIVNTCRNYLDFVPAFQEFVHAGGAVSLGTLPPDREQITQFIVHGLIVEPEGKTIETVPAPAR